MSNENNEMLLEEEMDIVELTDENDEVTQFQYLMTLEHQNEEYVVLMPLDEEEEESEEGEVVILKIEKDENGEDVYVSIEDEALSDQLFEIFLQNFEADEES